MTDSRLYAMARPQSVLESEWNSPDLQNCYKQLKTRTIRQLLDDDRLQLLVDRGYRYGISCNDEGIHLKVLSPNSEQDFRPSELLDDPAILSKTEDDSAAELEPILQLHAEYRAGMEAGAERYVSESARAELAPAASSALVTCCLLDSINAVLDRLHWQNESGEQLWVAELEVDDLRKCSRSTGSSIRGFMTSTLVPSLYWDSVACDEAYVKLVRRAATFLWIDPQFAQLLALKGNTTIKVEGRTVNVRFDAIGESRPATAMCSDGDITLVPEIDECKQEAREFVALLTSLRASHTSEQMQWATGIWAPFPTFLSNVAIAELVWISFFDGFLQAMCPEDKELP